MKTIQELGNRICIIGNSSSGKSTLAERLSRKLNFPVLHLDRIAHEAGTNWQRRSNDEFVREHDAILSEDAWIIEGNYSISMPQRFARATAIIWLDFSRYGCLMRYLRRCLKKDKSRPGLLDGVTGELGLGMVKHILGNYPRSRAKYERLLKPHENLVLHLYSMKELDRLCRDWEL